MQIKKPKQRVIKTDQQVDNFISGVDGEKKPTGTKRNFKVRTLRMSEIEDSQLKALSVKKHISEAAVIRIALAEYYDRELG